MIDSFLRQPVIAILLPDLRGGGAERVCVNLANEFARRGIAVDLVLMQRQGELLADIDPRISVVDLSSRRVRYGLRPLVTYLRGRKPDVLLANMWPLPVISLIARTLARCRTRVIGVEHTTWSIDEQFARPATRFAIRSSMRLAYPRLDALVTVSDGAADDLSLISGLPRERLTTIYNPIVGAPLKASPSEVFAKDWAEGSHAKVLAVGTLKAIKGFPTLLHAFARLRQRRDARLLILGEGDERSRLEGLVAALGLGEFVTMPGFALDTRPYYAAADLFVLSSTGEGFGNVIVEALDHAVPVVSTDCPSGPREILEDGKYGTLVPVGDVDALAAAMDDALSCEHDRDSLKRRAQNFSLDKAADAYLDLLLPGWRGSPQ